mmetsp:Transcript_2143/g.2735  ORF Transcript_2143/g.2735 Transcript_2143/m.2735 type:complete len:80 (+) Transcript_2143:546-785(+)
MSPITSPPNAIKVDLQSRPSSRHLWRIVSIALRVLYCSLLGSTSVSVLTIGICERVLHPLSIPFHTSQDEKEQHDHLSQ